MAKKKSLLTKIKSPWLLLAAILLSHSAGLIGSIGTAQSVDTWYITLVKPEFSPPNWVFGPVWLTLYTLMGVSLYLVWVQLKKPHGFFSWIKYKLQYKKRDQINSAVVFFFIHLIINALWSLVFFGLRDVGAAFVIIMLLWGMIATLIWQFAKYSKWASILLVPYWAWVSFAAVLNYSIWMLN